MTDEDRTDDVPVDTLNSQAFTVDRKRGLLTKGDRELLLEQTDYDNEQQVRDARYRMRQHLKAALLDAHIVSSRCSMEECAAVLRSVDRELGNKVLIASMMLASSLQKMAMKFLWAGFEHGGFNEMTNRDWDTEAELTAIIRRSIRSAARRAENEEQDQVINIDVDVSITRGEPDKSNIVKRAFRGGGGHQELEEYLEQEDLSQEDLDAIDAQFEEIGIKYSTIRDQIDDRRADEEEEDVG